MANMNMSNTSFLNWMLSISDARRSILLKDIAATLRERGLSHRKVVSMFRDIHTRSYLVLKRLSTKEILSYTRKKRKPSTKSKKKRSSKKKDEPSEGNSFDNEALNKKDNGFSPIITSVTSLQAEEGFEVCQSFNRTDSAQIKRNGCELSENEFTKQAENTYILYSSSSNLEKNEGFEKKSISDKLIENDSIKLTEVSNEDCAEARQAASDTNQQTSDMDCMNENNEIVLDNQVNRTNVKPKNADVKPMLIPQADNLQPQNNTRKGKITIEPVNKDQITKLQDTIKQQLMNKMMKSVGNNLQDKLKQSLSNNVSSVELLGHTSLSPTIENLLNTSNSREALKLKDTSNSLEKHVKPINTLGNLKEIKETMKPQTFSSLSREETQSTSNVLDTFSICNTTSDVSEEVVEKRPSDEPLHKEPSLADQMTINNSEKEIHKCTTFKVKTVKKQKTYEKKSKSGYNKNKKAESDLREGIKELASQAKLLEECLIARKRAADLALAIPKSKVKKMSTDKLSNPELILSDSSQLHKDNTEIKLQDSNADACVSNLHEVPTSSSTQQNITPTIVLDNRQPDHMLSTVESVADVAKGLVEDSVQNSSEKDSTVSDNAISDSTVSSSSMIETPSETCFTHDAELTVKSVIPVNVSSVMDKEQEPEKTEEPQAIQNTLNLCSDKLTDNAGLLPSQNKLDPFEEKLIEDSVNLYLRYFKKPSQGFNYVPTEVYRAIKDFVTSKGNDVGNITENAVIRTYLTLYTTHFDEVSNKVVSKTAEILHLAIADHNRREERKKLALRLNSDILRNEEINRADEDYKEILHLRGNTFSEMFLSILNKFDRSVILPMITTLYFRITQALLVIDLENMKYLRLIRKLMLSLLNVCDVEHSCDHFLNMPYPVLIGIYTFVKNCLVLFYLARYIQTESDIGNAHSVRFALFPPTSAELEYMVFDLITNHKLFSEQMFVYPSSYNNELLKKTANFESTQNKQSSTRLLQGISDRHTVTSRDVFHPEVPRDSNMRCQQNTSVDEEHNEVPLTFKEQTGTDQQGLEQNQQSTQASLSHQNYSYNQQNIQATSQNHLLKIPHQQQSIQPQTPRQTYGMQVPLQPQGIRARDPRLVRILLQGQNLQSSSQNPLQQQGGQTSLQQQSGTLRLAQRKLIEAALQNQNHRTLTLNQNQTNQMQQQRFQGPALRPQRFQGPAQRPQRFQGPAQRPQMPHLQQSNEVTRQKQLNQIPVSRTNLQAPMQTHFIQIPAHQHSSEVSAQNQMVQEPVQLLPVTTISQQPSAQQALPTQQNIPVVINQPSTLVSSQPKENNQPSLPQIQNLFNHLKHRLQFEQIGGTGQNEIVNRNVVTNVEQMELTSQPSSVAATQHAWRAHSSQQHSNAQEIQPTDANFRTLEEEYGSKKCDVRDCGRPASLACSLCKAVFYCSSNCQATHWYNEHSRMCLPK